MKLSDPVSKLPFVGPVYVKRLKKLGIKSIEDLLHHIPSRYVDLTETYQIASLQAGELATIIGQITEIKNTYTKSDKKIQVAKVSDGTGSINVIWFNQTYLVKALPVGTHVSLAGKMSFWNRRPAIMSPDYEKISFNKTTIHTGRVVPIFPETDGVSSKWLRARINTLINESAVLDNIDEFLTISALKKYDLISTKKALKDIHFPKSDKDVTIARKRLSFNELLFLQLANVFKRLDWEKNEVAHTLGFTRNQIKEFVNALPFELTNSQKQTAREILTDLQKKTPMNRLLEGDVGSGKTVVAAIAAFVSFLNGYQSVFMAPTQILAQQHFNTLNSLFKDFRVRVSLITSTSTNKNLSRTDIYVGTHALIHRQVDFDEVGLVVIDEQHRFGVEQRAHLINKSGSHPRAPHVLTMTATPIPRTIALTLHGDLELSTLTELPAGRKPITTWVVPPKKRAAGYEWIKGQIKKQGVQVFIVCPLIEESEKETMKQVRAVTSEYEKLKKIFQGFSADILHGRQKAKVKEATIKKFKKGKTHVLVSTPVVEVGIDIPNANIMIIEAAERFGLAQLHQLRGRIGRGESQAYCLLFTEKRSLKARQRLTALTKTLCGFELAELDLRLRGPGQIFGTLQHGFSELKIASWTDTELIATTRKLANEAVANPKKHKKLLSHFKTKQVVAN